MDKDFIFEMPVEYGGSLKAQERRANDGLMAFDIKTGAKQAQAKFEQNEDEQQKLSEKSEKALSKRKAAHDK